MFHTFAAVFAALHSTIRVLVQCLGLLRGRPDDPVEVGAEDLRRGKR